MTPRARVQAAMARHGVGALCLATPHLAAFASGARRVQVAGSGGTVPWVVIAAGAAPVVVFTTDPDGAPPGMAVEPLHWDRARQLARIAELVATTHGPVACDVFSPELRAALAGRELVDAAPLLADAVAPHDADEVAAIERALAAARTGLRAAAEAVVPGASAGILAARFAAAVSVSGAGFPLAEPAIRRDGIPLAPGDAIRAGDAVGLEFAVYVGGWAGVAGDTVGCGDGDLRARRRAWFEALCAIAKRCRAGVPASELAAAAAEAGAGQDGLLAHGLGTGIEPPLVDVQAEDDPAPLRAGTVLVLAPVVGGFRATRALVVGEGAPRWLEPAP